MELFTYFGFVVVLFYGLQLRTVDSKPTYARYCGSTLARELERRCRTRGYNGPKQEKTYLLFERRSENIGIKRSNDREDIIKACCLSACTEEVLDSYCLSSSSEEEATIESETVETTTIINDKKRRTKKPKPTRKSGRRSKTNKGGSELSEDSSSNKDYETQTDTPRNKGGREKNKNKDKNKEKKNKCNKKTLRDKYGNPCVRKQKDRSEKESRKNRKRNKKNKPTRRPKRWDSETTTLSDFLLSQRFLQGMHRYDVDDGNIDKITTQFEALPEDGDTSWSLSQEESSSNEVIADDTQRTEQFSPPFRPIATGTENSNAGNNNNNNNNMYLSADLPNTKTSLKHDPEARIKELKDIFEGIMQESTPKSRL